MSLEQLTKKYKMELMTDKQVRTMSKRYLKTMPDSQTKVLLHLLLEQSKRALKKESDIKKYFEFANYLAWNYDYHDNCENGDIYYCNESDLLFSEKEIYKKFLEMKEND